MKKVLSNEIKKHSLYWQTSGKGQALILLHGWGMNGAVWQQTVAQLSEYFCVHVVDLPGFGHSNMTSFSSIEDLANQVLEHAPRQAIWLGWSLGGLVATHIALKVPQRVDALITVASSPKFAAEGKWRGIQPAVLDAFKQQLLDDFTLTIERFMALQAMGSPSAKSDIKMLKQAVLSRPTPNPEALMSGLDILATVDYRQDLKQLTIPMLRLYGRLDGLVPRKVSQDVDILTTESTSLIFQASSHAPFITEADLFSQKIIEFANQSLK